jgi:hypothetical protein
MEENAASNDTIKNAQQIASPTAFYEPVQVSRANHQSDTTDKPAGGVVNSASKEDSSSHYQGLSSLTKGLSHQDQSPTYEPLRPNMTEPRAQQHDNEPNTYQPLGKRNSPSEYKSLQQVRSYDNYPKNNKRNDNESIT